MRQAKPQPTPDPQPSAASNDTDADLVAALQAAREHFAGPMEATMVAMRTLLAGRHPCQLTGRECFQHLTLRARFIELAQAQRDFAEAHLARLPRWPVPDRAAAVSPRGRREMQA
jgi:hypothetical protein